MITPGQAHDLACAEPLLDGADPDALIGDKAYDADPLIETLTRRQITPVIPPKANRKFPRVCDFALYCERNLVDIDQAWRLSRLCEGRGRSGLIWRRQTPPWERGSADCLQGCDRRVVGMDEDGMTGAHSYKAAA